LDTNLARGRTPTNRVSWGFNLSDREKHTRIMVRLEETAVRMPRFTVLMISVFNIVFVLPRYSRFMRYAPKFE
jgi:hypothetical protein